MSYKNSVRNLCFIWPAAFVRMHVYLLFVTIWVYAWEYVSYECHWSSVVAEAKLKTSAWGYFVYFCVVNSLPQVDASWISAITTILSLELQSHLLSHPQGMFTWLSYSCPNVSCLKLNSFSTLFPQPNCSLFSVVHFHWLYYHSPSSFRTLRIRFHVSKVESLVLFIF